MIFIAYVSETPDFLFRLNSVVCGDTHVSMFGVQIPVNDGD